MWKGRKGGETRRQREKEEECGAGRAPRGEVGGGDRGTSAVKLHSSFSQQRWIGAHRSRGGEGQELYTLTSLPLVSPTILHPKSSFQYLYAPNNRCLTLVLPFVPQHPLFQGLFLPSEILPHQPPILSTISFLPSPAHLPYLLPTTFRSPTSTSARLE